jgi:hypothetical protein
MDCTKLVTSKNNFVGKTTLKGVGVEEDTLNTSCGFESLMGGVGQGMKPWGATNDEWRDFVLAGVFEEELGKDRTETSTQTTKNTSQWQSDSSEESYVDPCVDVPAWILSSIYRTPKLREFVTSKEWHMKVKDGLDGGESWEGVARNLDEDISSVMGKDFASLFISEDTGTSSESEDNENHGGKRDGNNNNDRGNVSGNQTNARKKVVRRGKGAKARHDALYYSGRASLAWATLYAMSRQNRIKDHDMREIVSQKLRLEVYGDGGGKEKIGDRRRREVLREDVVQAEMYLVARYVCNMTLKEVFSVFRVMWAGSNEASVWKWSDMKDIELAKVNDESSTTPYNWAVSSECWNRLMHALNGNTSEQVVDYEDQDVLREISDTVRVYDEERRDSENVEKEARMSTDKDKAVSVYIDDENLGQSVMKDGVVEDYKHPLAMLGPVFRELGYKWLGPGNSGPEAPINALDSIARDHDIAYGKAKNADDLNRADQEMIEKLYQIYDTDALARVIIPLMQAQYAVRSGYDSWSDWMLSNKGMHSNNGNTMMSYNDELELLWAKFRDVLTATKSSSVFLGPGISNEIGTYLSESRGTKHLATVPLPGSDRMYNQAWARDPITTNWKLSATGAENAAWGWLPRSGPGVNMSLTALGSALTIDAEDASQYTKMRTNTRLINFPGIATFLDGVVRGDMVSYITGSNAAVLARILCFAVEMTPFPVWDLTDYSDKVLFNTAEYAFTEAGLEFFPLTEQVIVAPALPVATITALYTDMPTISGYLQNERYTTSTLPPGFDAAFWDIPGPEGVALIPVNNGALSDVALTLWAVGHLTHPFARWQHEDDVSGYNGVVLATVKTYRNSSMHALPAPFQKIIFVETAVQQNGNNWRLGLVGGTAIDFQSPPPNTAWNPPTDVSAAFTLISQMGTIDISILNTVMQYWGHMYGGDQEFGLANIMIATMSFNYCTQSATDDADFFVEGVFSGDPGNGMFATDLSTNGPLALDDAVHAFCGDKMDPNGTKLTAINEVRTGRVSGYHFSEMQGVRRIALTTNLLTFAGKWGVASLHNPISFSNAYKEQIYNLSIIMARIQSVAQMTVGTQTDVFILGQSDRPTRIYNQRRAQVIRSLTANIGMANSMRPSEITFYAQPSWSENKQLPMVLVTELAAVKVMGFEYISGVSKLDDNFPVKEFFDVAKSASSERVIYKLDPAMNVVDKVKEWFGWVHPLELANQPNGYYKMCLVDDATPITSINVAVYFEWSAHVKSSRYSKGLAAISVLNLPLVLPMGKYMNTIRNLHTNGGRTDTLALIFERLTAPVLTGRDVSLNTRRPALMGRVTTDFDPLRDSYDVILGILDSPLMHNNIADTLTGTLLDAQSTVQNPVLGKAKDKMDTEQNDSPKIQSSGGTPDGSVSTQ